MDYKDVSLFARVVEAGSFTDAAAGLGLPKSSVSRRVARLEEDLGVRLLQRTTRKLTLTDAGQTFYDSVKRALADLEGAAGAVREAGGEPRGTVRFTASADSFGLGRCVAEFSQRHPRVHIELLLSSRLVDLVGEGFDIALRGGVLRDSTLIARRIGSSDFALFAAPEYLRRRGRPKTLPALADAECILFRGHNGSATWKLTSAEGEESVVVHGPISADGMTFLGDVAIAGAGIALLPLMTAYPAVRDGLLERVLPAYRMTGASIHVVLPSSSFVPARVALFRDFLIDFMKRELEKMDHECSKHGRA